VLLDDQEALLRVHDMLEIGVLVARVDEEAARVRAYLLVEAERDSDTLGAGVVGALADEVGGLLVGPGLVQFLNAFVDLAKERLVATRTFFPERHAL
jgi:hypothetical protein